MTTMQMPQGAVPPIDRDGPVQHVGHALARALRLQGVEVLFTLSGAHLFSLYDGCVREGIRLVDVRHEQSAGFAAEAWAKLHRRPAACAVTAGPGVTNAMSAMGAAAASGAPVLFIGGRAPEHRWGQGSLQEIDHVPFVAPLVRYAGTVRAPEELDGVLSAALDAMRGAPTGPAFIDLPLDVAFSGWEGDAAGAAGDSQWRADAPAPPAEALAGACKALAASRRPVILAGSGVHWSRAEAELLVAAERHGAPVLVNGLGRGLVPTGHPNLMSGARGAALAGCDCAVVVGTPIDFRLGFGESIPETATFVHVDGVAAATRPQRAPDTSVTGDIRATLAALGAAAPDDDAAADRAAWLDQLREVERGRGERDAAMRVDERAPMHPARLIAEVDAWMDDDAIVVGDGGDFVSYAGRMLRTSGPGSFHEPGPFGCLGFGPGAAMAAKLAAPDRQVVLLLGDGATGFSIMEFDTMLRHGLPVVAVVGNNGMWALEHHPMQMLMGYSVTNLLRPETRYDEIVRALGGHGELVRTPSELRPALDRARASGLPALVNVCTDPEVAYPRSTNLA